MVILNVDSIGRAWSNCFYHYGTWENLETNILKDWRGQLVFDAHSRGVVLGIKFEHDSDATLFLLRWS